jgi:hypothetical protein
MLSAPCGFWCALVDFQVLAAAVTEGRALRMLRSPSQPRLRSRLVEGSSNPCNDSKDRRLGPGFASYAEDRRLVSIEYRLSEEAPFPAQIED